MKESTQNIVNLVTESIIDYLQEEFNIGSFEPSWLDEYYGGMTNIRHSIEEQDQGLSPYAEQGVNLVQRVIDQVNGFYRAKELQELIKAKADRFWATDGEKIWEECETAEDGIKEIMSHDFADKMISNMSSEWSIPKESIKMIWDGIIQDKLGS